MAHPKGDQLIVDIRLKPVTAVDRNRDNQPFKADQAAAAVEDLHHRIQTLRKVRDQEQMFHLMVDIQLDPEVQLERILVHPAVFRRHIQVLTLYKAKDQELVVHQMVDTRLALDPELQFQRIPEHLTQQLPMFIMQFEAHSNCRRVCVWLDVIHLDPINRV